MQWSTIAINVLLTLVFCWLLIWTLFAWGLGLTNFQRKYNKWVSSIGAFLWLVLIIGHVVAIYILWSTTVSTLLIISVLLAFHTFYGLTFARNVSAR